MANFREAKANRPRVWRLFDQSLGVQFLTAGGLVALAFLASLTVLISQVRKQADASRLLNNSHSAISRLTLLGRDMYRQQTAVFGFLQSREPRYIGLVQDGHRTWNEGFAVIRELFEGDPIRGAQLELLGKKYESWAALTDGVLKGARSLNDETVNEEASLSKDAFQLIDQMVNEQDQRISIWNSYEKKTIRASLSAIVLINLALFGLFAYVLMRLYTSIANPISSLSEAMTEFQKGDWNARVKVSSRNQIGFLQMSFNQMARKIQAMVADLKKLDEMKTEFVSTVSHELRTPLTSIGGYTKLLVAEDAGKINETQREFLGIIETNVERLTDLINDILDVEKMESGKIDLQREKMDLLSILKECVGSFKPLAAQKGLELRLKAQDRPLFVQGDRARLVRVFVNLISNAVKYTPKGWIEIEAEEQNFAIIVRVRDTGIGIAPADQAKLFQKFYRTGEARLSDAIGTGLGLVIARGLVEAHQGRISLESSPGKGTTFTVVLPSAEILSESSRGDLAIEPLASASSSPLTRQGAVWVFGSGLSEVPGSFGGGREVRAAESVESMGALLSGNLGKPALVVIDADQFVLDDVMKKLPEDVPVLVVSSVLDAGRAFSQGAGAFLQKPISPEEYQRAVRDLLRARGGRVLIADPNPDVRLLMKRSLEQNGYIVDDVDHGGLVLRRLDQEAYDLVLIDLSLPDVSGAELLKAIRKSPLSAKTPVVVMLDDERNKASGEIQRPLSREGLVSLGADHFIGKYEGIGGISDAVTEFLIARKAGR